MRLAAALVALLACGCPRAQPPLVPQPLTVDDVSILGSDETTVVYSVSARLETEHRCRGTPDLVECSPPLRTENCVVSLPLRTSPAEAVERCRTYLTPRSWQERGLEVLP